MNNSGGGGGLQLQNNEKPIHKNHNLLKKKYGGK